MSVKTVAACVARLATKLDEELPGIEAFVIDDTGFPRRASTPSVFNASTRAVSMHLAGEQGSGMVGFRLFLSDSWVADRVRRKRSGIPTEVGAATKGTLALAQLDAALAAGVRRHVVLADAGYGDSADFRDAVAQRDLRYVVAVNGEPVVWPPGSSPRVMRKARRPPLADRAKALGDGRQAASPRCAYGPHIATKKAHHRGSSSGSFARKRAIPTRRTSSGFTKKKKCSSAKPFITDVDAS